MAPALLLLALLQAAPREYHPFAINPQCRCFKPLARLPDLNWTERAEGRTLYQVFTSTTTGRELFRRPIGDRHGNEWIKWWGYGLVHTADYNADGRPDYAWDGGDDTSQSQILLLSSESGYRQLNVVETLNAAWARRYPGRRRDFSLILSDYNVRDTTLAADGPELTLIFQVESLAYPPPKEKVQVLRVDAADFVYHRGPNPGEFRPFARAVGTVKGPDFASTASGRFVHTADYNADGHPDYAWAGGDDTGDDKFLLLSTGTGHRTLDVLATLQTAWDNRYPNDRRDFRRLDPTHELFSIVLDERGGALSLTFRIRNLRKPADPIHTVRVSAAGFVFTSR